MSSPETKEDIMNFKQLFAAVPLALLVLGNSAAKAGQTINEAGALVCVADKWTSRSLTKATSWSILAADAS
jgi:hypothetical protein